MADILALGISHYPPLMGEDTRMAYLLKLMLRNPGLPERLRDPANWPGPMREEWGDDEGVSAAARHRERLVGWMRKVRAALDAFNPDFVLIWGDDQYENFREDIIPPYCVNAHPDFRFHMRPGNIWSVSPDTAFETKGHVAAGKYLSHQLLQAGFDTAYSYRPMHLSLGHAFANAVFYLDYDRTGFPWPILPVSVNCYGRRVICQKGGAPQFNSHLTEDDLDPAAPAPWRLFDLGGATARILVDSPWRIAILASSGWSHAFLTEKNHYLFPDTSADRLLYGALIAGDYQSWRNHSARSIEASGQQEVLNWMCLAGALDELNRIPAEADFVDTWIFNSSKVFLIAPPNDAE